MFDALLIANRGEIACRIIETCRMRGIRSIAVYSDADAGARHVREADLAMPIGASPASDSYLNIEALIEAAKASGADAIHPGYGFLAESAAFAEAVEAAGFVWVGPTPETIRALGAKDEAKALAEAASVPILPGYRGDNQDPASLAEAAEDLGYPLLIKAVSGGGGRGIRSVESADGFASALESAVREAKSAFGDGRVMLEKLIATPRHIEVQVFGDGRGKAVHLFERDCSLQRRRQKVVEEAPAPNMPEAVRSAMCDAAVRLAESVSYRGAGTVEFIVDGDKPLSDGTFWFLEMNTRLQVEHPVTEMITGQDLVDWQLRIAAGEGLPATQDEIDMCGHAIEVRICAEDPDDDFRPGTGLIEAFGLFDESTDDDVRLDTGFEAGDRVPAHYDSLIAKLIVGGADRDDAIARLTTALDQTQLIGVAGNVGFLRRCLESDAFQSGTHAVTTIETLGDALTAPPHSHRDAAVAACVELQLRDGGDGPWSYRDGWRLNAAPVRRAAVDCQGETIWRDGGTPVELPETPPRVTVFSPRRFGVTIGGDSLLMTVPDYEAEAEALAGGDHVAAPMPGKVIAIEAAAGQTVSLGDPVVVLEAMKMEHTLASPRDGMVESVAVTVGDQVAEGTILVALVSED